MPLSPELYDVVRDGHSHMHACLIAAQPRTVSPSRSAYRRLHKRHHPSSAFRCRHSQAAGDEHAKGGERAPKRPARDAAGDGSQVSLLLRLSVFFCCGFLFFSWFSPSITFVSRLFKPSAGPGHSDEAPQPSTRQQVAAERPKQHVREGACVTFLSLFPVDL